MDTMLYIKVMDRLGELLNSREAATTLFDLVKAQKAVNIEFDFDNVTFMSRSFADQFHKDRNALEKANDLTIGISNANEEIIKMFKTVARTQNKSKRAFIKLPVYKFSNKDSLSDYLHSV